MAMLFILFGCCEYKPIFPFDPHGIISNNGWLIETGTPVIQHYIVPSVMNQW